MSENILLAIGVLLVAFSFLVDTKNDILNKLVFKLTPFSMGAYIIVYVAHVSGYINI